MKTLLVTVFSVFFIQSIWAQKESKVVKFGEFTRVEKEMTYYENDPEAEAVVLYDYGESNLTLQNFNFKRHTRIKILKKSGYRWADNRIALRKGSNGRLSKFKASTFNLENGKWTETELTSEGFFKEDFNDWTDVIRFTMPNVKEGSIIEYMYEIDDVGLVDWKFQTVIPTVWSENKIAVTDLVSFNKLLSGFLIPYIFEEKSSHCGTGACNLQRIVMKDVPAFRDEPFIPARENFLSKISYEIASIKNNFKRIPINILSSWDDMAWRYWENQFFGSNVKGTAFLKKTAHQLVENLNEPDEMVMAIYDYVKSNLSWNDRYSIRVRDLKKALENKEGNSAELNLMLLAMMRYAGLPAEPVLISTRENGFVRREVPNSKQFNHIIVLTDLYGQKRLIDATNKYLPIDFLPEACLNGFGYISNREAPGWVEVENLSRTKFSVTGEFNIEDKLLKGSVKVERSGYEAETVRRLLQTKGEDAYRNQVSLEYGADIMELSVSNKNDLDKELVEDYEVEFEDVVQAKDNLIFFNPIVFTRIKENPFKREERKFPVDFKFPREIVLGAKFIIPEGFEVDELPQPKLSVLPGGDGKFIYSSSTDGKSISIVSQFILNRTVYSADDYLALRELYNIVVAKQNELIVLKKIEE